MNIIEAIVSWLMLAGCAWLLLVALAYAALCILGLLEV